MFQKRRKNNNSREFEDKVKDSCRKDRVSFEIEHVQRNPDILLEKDKPDKCKKYVEKRMTSCDLLFDTFSTQRSDKSGRGSAYICTYDNGTYCWEGKDVSRKSSQCEEYNGAA